MTEPTHSMLRMMERHSILEAHFLEHQTAILDRDLERARDALARYAQKLDAHMSEEEARILPLYDGRCPQVPGGQTKMFLDEHARLRVLVANLVRGVAALSLEPKAVLSFLDEETQFRHYMDHHDRRERAFLYPALDAALSEDERSRLLAELG